MKIDTPLRALRKERGFTLTEVASAIGSDIGNLSRVERGKQISPDLAARLVEYFGHGISEIEILYPERFAPSKAAPCPEPEAI